MKEINFKFDKYYYFTDSDNKVDFNSTDFIGDINWVIFNHL